MTEQLQASLLESAKARQELRRRFGFIPVSVIREIARGELSDRMFIYQAEDPARRVSMANPSVTDLAKSPEALAKTEERRRLVGVGGKMTRKLEGDMGKTGLSIMPAELVDFFVKWYAAPGQVYLDPFMGQGIQMQVAHLRGLHYYGYDLSAEFCRYIRSVRDRIDNGKTVLAPHEGDSRFPTEIPDGIGDFSFHSPPYWYVEHYGDEPAQLGKIGDGSYEAFLQGMEDVARAWLPKFKPGAYHVVNVGDFRVYKAYYGYQADTVALFRRAGWEYHDCWIVDGLVGGLSRVYAAKRYGQKIAPKVHEFCLVFRRPTE